MSKPKTTIEQVRAMVESMQPDAAALALVESAADLALRLPRHRRDAFHAAFQRSLFSTLQRRVGLEPAA